MKRPQSTTHEAKEPPQDIEWSRVRRGRDADKTTVRLSAYTDASDRRSVRLSVPKKVLLAAGFRVGDRLLVLQGAKPHKRWLKIVSTDDKTWGVAFTENKPAQFSIGSYLKRDLNVDETLEPFVKDRVIYFELAKSWINND